MAHVNIVVKAFDGPRAVTLQDTEARDLRRLRNALVRVDPEGEARVKTISYGAAISDADIEEISGGGILFFCKKISVSASAVTPKALDIVIAYKGIRLAWVERGVEHRSEIVLWSALLSLAGVVDDGMEEGQ